MESRVGRNSYISNFRKLRNAKKLPIAFLSSILLFIVIQSILLNSGAFWRFCYFWSNPGADDGIRIEAQLRTVSATEEQGKIFLTGSSQTREDFDVEYLNNQFSKEQVVFYNLGISGAAHPIEMYMLKEELLSKDPDIIIYVPFVASFYTDCDFSKIKYYFDPIIIPRIIEYEGMQNIISQRVYLEDSFLGKAFFTYKYRESLDRILENAVKNYLNIEKRTEPQIYGYTDNKPESYFEDEIKKANKNKYYVSQYTELNEELFILFAKDVVSEGVKLIVISGPTHPLIKLCYSEELDIAYNNFITEQASKIGFTYLREDQLPSFTAEDFIDFTHLNAQGRSKMSRFLEIYLEENNLP